MFLISSVGVDITGVTSCMKLLDSLNNQCVHSASRHVYVEAASFLTDVWGNTWHEAEQGDLVHFPRQLNERVVWLVLAVQGHFTANQLWDDVSFCVGNILNEFFSYNHVETITLLNTVKWNGFRINVSLFSCHGSDEKIDATLILCVKYGAPALRSVA